MKSVSLVAALALLCAACGEKAKETKEATSAMGQLGQLAASAGKMQSTADEAAKFIADRRAKGDTIAIPYKDLEGFLPSSLSGYNAEGGPKGQSMNMGAFSMSSAEQTWVSDTTSNARRVHMTIADYTGSEAGYGMIMPFMAMNMSTEDDHHRGGSVKIDMPTTFAFEEFNKDNKDAKISLGTRYRYFITIEATNQKDDVTKELVSMAMDVAKKLSNK